MSEIQININNPGLNGIDKASSAKPVAYIGNHQVKLGNNPPINLKSLGTSHIPFQGFKKATRLTSELKGMTQIANDMLSVLQRTDGKLDATRLLRKLNTMDTYLAMYSKTTGKALDTLYTVPTERMAPAVQALSNKQLAAAYGALCSHEMTDLKEALEYMSRRDPEVAGKCSSCLEQLMNLEALIVSESSKRFATYQIAREGGDNAPTVPTLTQSHCSEEEIGTHDNEVVEQQKGDKDSSAVSLAIMMETQASSDIRRGETGTLYKSSMASKIKQPPELKEIGDYLRQQELAINIDLKYIFGYDNNGKIQNDKNSFPVNDPNFQLKNCFNLKDEGIEQDEIYVKERKFVEDSVFPFLKGDYQGTHRPIYGALNTKKAVGGPCFSYGCGVIVLKQHVKQNATYTYGDTFAVPNLKFTPAKEQAFVDDLKKYEGYMTEATVKALKDEKSNLRKEITKLFASEKSINIGFVKTGGEFEAIHKLLKFKDNLPENQDASVNRLLEACLSSVCLEIDHDYKNTASFDNIEKLVPKMSDKDQVKLAMQVASNKQGNVRLRDAQYIEAQLHQPIDLRKDVAEIRFMEDCLPSNKAEKEKVIKALNAWSQETGIKVVIVTEKMDWEVAMRSTDEETETKAEQFLLNDRQKVLLDKVDSMIESKEGVDEYIEALPDSKEIKAFLGDVQVLDGTNYGEFASKQHARMKDNINWSKDIEDLTDKKFHASYMAGLKANLDVKVDLLREMMNNPKEYAFDTKEQQQAFTKWVVESKALKTKGEMKLLYNSARSMMDMLQKVGEDSLKAEDLPVQIHKLVADLDKSLVAYVATLSKGKDFGYDEKATEVNRMIFLGVAMLKNSGKMPEGTMQKIHEAISSPAFMNFRNAFDSTVEFATQVIEGKGRTHAQQNQDSQVKLKPNWHTEEGQMGLMQKFLYLFDQQICRECSLPTNRVKNLPLKNLDPLARDAITSILPTIGEYAAIEQPYKTRELAPMAKPDLNCQLPKTLADRKKFLMKCLPLYRQHEKDFDFVDFHGRSHATRAFIFANVLCNILKEQGIDVDINAVAMLTAGHDIGRRNNGPDRDENRSATITKQLITEMLPENSSEPGEAYMQGVEYSITSKENDCNTIEAYVLHSADSMDYSRCGKVKMEYFPFLRDTIKLGGKEVVCNQELRDELIREAELLTRVSHPYYLTEVDIDQSPLDIMGNDDDYEMVSQLRNHSKELMKFRTDHVSDADLVNDIESAIRNNPQDFPLLNKYYKD